MFLNIKKGIRSCFSKLLRRLYPYIPPLNNPDEWHLLSSVNEDFLTNAENDVTYKLYKPYHIYQTTIGDYTYISQNSYISCASVGKFCSIGPNLICGWGIHPATGISTSPMFYSTEKQNGVSLSSTNKVEERKHIVIGNDVFMGANVTIIDGVTIGDGAIIGAGAVVSKDIPPYAIAIGCPIQILKYRFTEEQRTQLLKIKWWDFSFDKLKDVEEFFFDIDAFIKAHTQ